MLDIRSGPPAFDEDSTQLLIELSPLLECLYLSWVGPGSLQLILERLPNLRTLSFSHRDHAYVLIEALSGRWGCEEDQEGWATDDEDSDVEVSPLHRLRHLSIYAPRATADASLIQTIGQRFPHLSYLSLVASWRSRAQASAALTILPSSLPGLRALRLGGSQSAEVSDEMVVQMCAPAYCQLSGPLCIDRGGAQALCMPELALLEDDSQLPPRGLVLIDLDGMAPHPAMVAQLGQVHAASLRCLCVRLARNRTLRELTEVLDTLPRTLLSLAVSTSRHAADAAVLAGSGDSQIGGVAGVPPEHFMLELPLLGAVARLQALSRISLSRYTPGLLDALFRFCPMLNSITLLPPHSEMPTAHEVRAATAKSVPALRYLELYGELTDETMSALLSACVSLRVFQLNLPRGTPITTQSAHQVVTSVAGRSCRVRVRPADGDGVVAAAHGRVEVEERKARPDDESGAS